MSTTEDWRQQIRKKLIEIYGNDEETVEKFIILLAFFNKETEKEMRFANFISPFSQTLKMALELNNDVVFKEYSDRMMTDAEKILKSPDFYHEMEGIYRRFAEPNNKGADEGVFLLAENLGEVVKTFSTDYRALSSVDETVSILSKAGGQLVMVGLAAVYLTFDCYKNMRRWWRGEITGKRCAIFCIDSISQVAGGMGGGFAGAVIGSLIYPIMGTLVGGLAGSLFVGFVAKVLSDAVTRNIFDLPKDEALEKAFHYLGVHYKASKNEINKAFHRLALKYHPDKGGSAVEFHLLQFHMTRIKLAKGENNGRAGVLSLI